MSKLSAKPEEDWKTVLIEVTTSEVRTIDCLVCERLYLNTKIPLDWPLFGGPRDTENNPDYWEIFEFLSAVYVSIFRLF